VDYTDKQYAFLERFKNGAVATDFTDDELMHLSYFEKQQLLCPRVDIRDNYWVLTEEGQRVLYHRQKAIRAAKIQTLEKIQQLQEQELIRQEDIRHEQEQERKRLDEAAAAKADRAAEKRADHKFQIALAFINFVLSFLAGVLVEHFAGIVDWIRFVF